MDMVKLFLTKSRVKFMVALPTRVIGYSAANMDLELFTKRMAPRKNKGGFLLMIIIEIE